MKLSEIKQGDCEILSVPSAGDAAKRLARLGIAAGQRVRLLRRAPFGGGEGREDARRTEKSMLSNLQKSWLPAAWRSSAGWPEESTAWDSAAH